MSIKSELVIISIACVIVFVLGVAVTTVPLLYNLPEPRSMTTTLVGVSEYSDSLCEISVKSEEPYPDTTFRGKCNLIASMPFGVPITLTYREKTVVGFKIAGET